MARIRLSDQTIIQFCKYLESLLISGQSLTEALMTIINHSSLKSYIQLASKCINPSNEVIFIHPEKELFYQAFFDIIKQLQSEKDTTKIKTVLAQLLVDIERRSNLRKGILSQLQYPIKLFIMMVVIVTAMLTYVVPQFAAMFSELGVTLPLPTEILFSIARVFNDNSSIVLILLIILLGSTFMFRKQIGDYFLSILPMTRSMMREISHAQFLGYTASLTLLGHSFVTATTRATEIVSNKYFQKLLKNKKSSVSQYQQISIAFSEPLIASILETSERNNTLPETLDSLSNQSISSIEDMSKSYLSFIEQASIIVIGIIVGLVLVSLYAPIFSISTVIM